MTETRIVRYTTTPESAEENARLIRAVFAELAERELTGVRYSAHRLDDGVSFVHVATTERGDASLTTLESFAAFQAGIADRCVDGPHVALADVVGSFGVGAPH